MSFPFAHLRVGPKMVMLREVSVRLEKLIRTRLINGFPLGLSKRKLYSVVLISALHSMSFKERMIEMSYEGDAG